jgi:hypothetical protein
MRALARRNAALAATLFNEPNAARRSMLLSFSCRNAIVFESSSQPSRRRDLNREIASTPSTNRIKEQSGGYMRNLCRTNTKVRKRSNCEASNTKAQLLANANNEAHASTSSTPKNIIKHWRTPSNDSPTHPKLFCTSNLHLTANHQARRLTTRSNFLVSSDRAFPTQSIWYDQKCIITFIDF